MKIIDLLNRIANGEEVPKKIKYINKIFDYDSADYFNTDIGYLFERCTLCVILNDEVEILEEKKILEKINISNFPRHNNSLKKTAIKVNEIIDYLKSKGE